jgi:heme A synthase
MFVKLFVRYVAVLLVSVALSGGLVASSWAGVIGTGQLLQQHNSESLETVLSALERQQVLHRLSEMGVDPKDAEARMVALDAAQIAEIHANLDTLPAGEGVLEVAVAVLVVLLILDLVGVTDIFSFIP